MYDEELQKEAEQKVLGKAKDIKYLNSRQVTENDNVVPRWGSDMELLKQIAYTQQKTLNPEAIFGHIDPRKINRQYLNQIFDDKKKFSPFLKYSKQKKNENSGRAKWNDTSEFATPNVLLKQS